MVWLFRVPSAVPTLRKAQAGAVGVNPVHIPHSVPWAITQKSGAGPASDTFITCLWRLLVATARVSGQEIPEELEPLL